MDDKYIVFKRAEWEKHESRLRGSDLVTPVPVEDAIVIRRQDIFAATALHAYADNIACTLDILEILGNLTEVEMQARIEELQAIREYFKAQAFVADQEPGKVPD